MVVTLPADEATWVGHSQDALVLRRCGYWVSLRGLAMQNETRERVMIPPNNVFDPDALRVLMDKVRTEGRV
ncbi:MAG: hypothetical protein KF901_07405 [Myxococcales bacterium]|nr:hypothetical protein [Myxococcales bacterium]